MSRPRLVTTVNQLPNNLVDMTEYSEWFSDGRSAGDWREEFGSQTASSTGVISYTSTQNEYPSGKAPVIGIAAMSLGANSGTVVNCRAGFITGVGGTNSTTDSGTLDFGRGAMVLEARVRAFDAGSNNFAQGGSDFTRFGVGFLRWHAPSAGGYCDHIIGFARADSNGTGNYPAQGPFWHATVGNNHQSTIRMSYQVTTARLSEWNTLRIEISPTADVAEFFVNGVCVRVARRSELGLTMPAPSYMNWPGDNFPWTDQPYTHGVVQLRNNAVTANNRLDVDYALCRIETNKRGLG